MASTAASAWGRSLARSSTALPARTVCHTARLRTVSVVSVQSPAARPSPVWRSIRAHFGPSIGAHFGRPFSTQLPPNVYAPGSEGVDPVTLRKRCLYHARERGMRENDMVLGTFAEKYLEELTDEEVRQFSDLLQELDPDIWDWISGRSEPPQKFRNGLFDRIIAHSKTVADMFK